MIPYIGDISKEDAGVILECAKNFKNILEFGCGASTQIIAAYNKGIFVSIDTDEYWINKTISNIKLLEITKTPVFCKYENFDFSTGEYDFVFDDGVDFLREKFANLIWSHIIIDGVLAFHDTRREKDMKTVTDFIASHIHDISMAVFNYKNSNISLIYKTKPKPYIDWTKMENRKIWQTGEGNPDVEYIKAELKKNE